MWPAGTTYPFARIDTSTSCSAVPVEASRTHGDERRRAVGSDVAQAHRELRGANVDVDAQASDDPAERARCPRRRSTRRPPRRSPRSADRVRESAASPSGHHTGACIPCVGRRATTMGSPPPPSERRDRSSSSGAQLIQRPDRCKRRSSGRRASCTKASTRASCSTPFSSPFNQCRHQRTSRATQSMCGPGSTRCGHPWPHGPMTAQVFSGRAATKRRIASR